MSNKSRFGQYGGVYAPETLIPALKEIEEAFESIKNDSKFNDELNNLLKEYVGRPTSLTHCLNLSNKLGPKIYLKREDLAHTGAHKINNALGQGLLAKYLGKKRIIAETGAGQHGVATATVGAKLGIPTEIFMGKIDCERQKLNVFRMKLLGAKVHEVTSGGQTLKDAVNEAMRSWTANIKDTYYLLGSALGPHPYPSIVAHFQSIIGTEARSEIMQLENKLPKAVIACVGGGSNAIGIFKGFINDNGVRLIGVEAGGLGLHTNKHAARLGDKERGRPGVLHGSFTYVLQDKYGQIFNTHSISAGLDYSAIGPEHSYLNDINRAEYVSATDDEALLAVKTLSQLEGIIPALESAHAIAHAIKISSEFDSDDIILVNLSGRGDKDMEQILKEMDSRNYDI